MDCHVTVLEACSQPGAAVSCRAKEMGPAQRQELAVKVLARNEPVCAMARQERVSRKFLYQQATKAEEALRDAFSLEQPDHDEVLFYLPVTKAWIEQLVVGLALDCHSSVRGVVDLLEDVFDWPLSVGTVHNILHQAMQRARPYNTPAGPLAGPHRRPR